ncbi:MAG: glycosyltransferase [Deltaproteobacteria bacterium]|nr:glycosyltransferase [Deltaproteobacteria bacterium]
MRERIYKADLHVHSKYSTRPSEWVLQKIGCAESYTDPRRLYNLAKERGMDFVTITDHNTIAGSLEIAHLNDAFISEEITTYFPEDRCKIHVLAYDITEKQHDEISRLRENIYDLIKFLRYEDVVHAVAHPMFSLNDRLTHENFERLLLIFKNFEINGTRDDYQNRILKNILDNMRSENISLLSEKYGIEPAGPEPWKKNITGGSDDHSSLNIARTYTVMENASTYLEFLKGITEGKTRVDGKASTPKTMSHNLYSIAYQFYKSKFKFDKYTNDESLLRFAECILAPDAGAGENFMKRIRGYIGYQRPGHFYRAGSNSLQDILFKAAREIIYEDPEMKKVIKKESIETEEMEEIWFRFVNLISEQVLKHFADSTLTSLSGANFFDIFNTMGSAGFLYTMLAPYFVSYGLFTKDRKFCRDINERMTDKNRNETSGLTKVAYFTDTFHDVNGVARTLQMQVEAVRNAGKEMTMITCGNEQEQPGVVNFSPIGAYDISLYKGLKLNYPPPLRILDFCYRENFTHIHSATPGPMGLAALGISRILKLPFIATYHTAFPQYVDHLTGDSMMGELIWKYMVWFYNQADMVLVPSGSTGDELAARGIPKEKIRHFHRGFDIRQFHPARRNGFYKHGYNIDDKAFKLLYVGRVSKEKNLHMLSEIAKRLNAANRDIHLIIVGDGPYMQDLKTQLGDNGNVTFTGYLKGGELSQAYASGDLFIFPSTTDTFGNVVIEAQASGLPVIVTDQGGPRENMIDGKTGYIVPAEDVDAFVSRILEIYDDRDILKRMGNNARDYIVARAIESDYLKNWEYYKELRG